MSFGGRNAFKVLGLVVAFGAVSAAGQGRNDCWMTGGGSIFDTVEVTYTGRTTHGFELHCDRRNPNNLQINWDGNRFHLENLTAAVCTDDPDITPNPPGASFDTFTGFGTGRYNGNTGYCAAWTFTDAGEGGSGDWASIEIDNCGGGTTVLNVQGFLTFGNHQAHSK
jgi:hypothetical protein